MITINKNLKIESKNNHLELNDIKKFEDEFKIKLSKEYTEFLLKCNGGVPSQNKISFVYRCKDKNYESEEEKECYVDNFLSLDEIIWNLNFINHNPDKREFPDSMIEIAGIDGDSKILLSISGHDYGYIYFWDYNTSFSEGDDEGEPDYRNLELLGTNFKKFLKKFSNPFYSEFEEYSYNKKWDKCINLIKNGFNAKSLDELGHSLVSCVLNYGCDEPELIKILIENGAEYKEFITSAIGRNIKVVETLINYGADINYYNKLTGFTPITLAIGMGVVEVVELLIKNNVNLNIKDRFGLSLIELANKKIIEIEEKKEKYEKIIQLLEEAMKNNFNKSDSKC